VDLDTLKNAVAPGGPPQCVIANIIICSHTINCGGTDVTTDIGEYADSLETVFVHFDPIEHGGHFDVTMRLDINSVAKIVADHRVRNFESALNSWSKRNTSEGEISNNAIADGQTATGVEYDAVGVCDGSAIAHHADDIDGVARVRIDGDCCTTADWRNRSPAMPFNADRTSNGQRAVIGRIEHVYLAVGSCIGVGGREVPAVTSYADNNIEDNGSANNAPQQITYK
jgi:hypothetical protein